jgi:hypothetical protein
MAGASMTRWPEFEERVLRKLDDAEQVIALVLRRQREVDVDATEADVIAGHLRERLRGQGHDPDTSVVFLPTAVMADLLEEATREKRPVTRVTPYLRSLGIAELSYTKRTGRPGWLWKGRRVKPNERAVVVEPWRRDPAD